MKDYNLNELIEAYPFEGNFDSAYRINDGHINNTFVFVFKDETEKIRKYIVQELNTSVFKEPVALMNNISGVSHFLRKKLKEDGADYKRGCLYVYKTNDGKNYFIDSDNRFWRVFNFIFNAHSVQSVENPEVFAASGKAFGKFQCMLADYPIDTLAETIPNFHNTVSRFADFKKAVNDNLSGRKCNCEKETEFVLAREKDCAVLVDLLNKGELPLRVTHNDTKLNNVMFDDDSNEGICVVDLDTVMPGLSLYDFGDAIRFGASTAAEDEKDLDKVHFSPEYFAAYTEGFLSAAGKSLTKKEIEYLPFSSKLMTLECGMRFLGDYINGDTYFKTEYPEHNLDRCHTQFRLVEEMEEQMENMQSIVYGICEKLGIEI